MPPFTKDSHQTHLNGIFQFYSIPNMPNILIRVCLYYGTFSPKHSLPSEIVFGLAQQYVLFSQHKYKIMITDGRIFNQLKP